MGEGAEGMNSFEDICDTFTIEDQCRNLRDRMVFQYFNANGIYAEIKAFDEDIATAVSRGHCKNGMHYAYGMEACELHLKDMRRWLHRKTPPSKWQLDYCLSRLRQNLKDGRELLAKMVEDARP